MKYWYFLIFLTFISSAICNGARILVLTPMGSKSHKNFYMGITKSLAERGHKVTIVSAFKNSKEYPNVRDYAVNSETSTNILDSQEDIFNEGISQIIVYKLLTVTPTLCVDFLATKEVQDLKKEKFDLILLSIFFSDCFSSLLHHFQVPFILASPAGIVAHMYDLVGEAHFLSLSGFIIMPATYPFDFIYRLKSTVASEILNLISKHYTLKSHETLCKERGLCPQDMPPIIDIYRNVSLAIANRVKALDVPAQPSMPHVINIGGSHCVAGQPLPNELEQWVQGAGEHGFILFSLGSALPPSKLPERMRKILLNVFGSLKQRVLLKWDSTMEDLPSNVRLQKWLPQQDILAHPKLKLFITHGGLLSTLEATYNGVPILGMPVFGDQQANINLAVNQGWAMSLLWSELTEEKLKNKILDVMHNQKMKSIIKDRAKLMNDVPMSPRSEAVYWIEYVLRHNGAKHLRSPLHDLSLIQLYNMDVWALLISTAVILIGANIYLTISFLKWCLRSKSIPSKKKIKKQ